MKLGSYFGAHESADRGEQERERASQRAVVSGGLLLFWGVEALQDSQLNASLWFILVTSAYLIGTIWYWIGLRKDPRACVFCQYGCLLLDPILLTGVLAQDPGTFAFLNPFVLIVIIRSGIRFGVGAMYLTWAAALLASLALLLVGFWRTYYQLTASYMLMVALVPVFFVSLIERIHKVRAIEEERARLTAARESVEASSSLLAAVSHELRSPLQAIISSLDVFERRKWGILHEGDELIARMRRSSLLLNAQLRDLLTLAKGQTGRLELRPEVFDARELVSALAGAAREFSNAKGLRLDVSVPPKPLFVVADAARVDQILTNLVVNAIRHTNSGSIKVALVGYDAAQCCVTFCVDDDGEGLPLGALETLSGRTTHLKTLGLRTSGLGLSIVRTLLNHVAGSLTVSTSPSGGTTCRVSIPAELTDADSTPSVMPPDDRRLLLIAPGEALRSRVSYLLEQAGFTCDIATSAAAGANRLAVRSYRVALVDSALPGKDGAQFVAEVRNGSGPNASTRFVALADGEYRIEASSGFDATLVNPRDSASVAQVLDALLAAEPDRVGSA